MVQLTPPQGLDGQQPFSENHCLGGPAVGWGQAYEPHPWPLLTPTGVTRFPLPGSWN